LKQLFIIIIVFFTVVACNKSNEEADKKSQVNVAKELIRIPTLVLILQNIMSCKIQFKKGDGTIINEQNIEDRRIYDIVEKVKDTFNVRSIRPNKAFTMLRSKDKKTNYRFYLSA
jgi:hypothetical protein